ncbi:hypothetical protein AGOR_G00008380 [Albula goreensis]|uniref:Uncharacterized protein n=1 Tax=Albula goreensis TaxID=1534307 RepID=A0A8T3E9T5_9TELE|nr:hypothetical protein AGOR_G00008380 [Albula goreensis]
MPITQEPPQGIVGCLDHPNVEKESTAVAAGTESGSEGKKNEINHQAMSVTSASPLTRTGRKPRGFLSFISDKSTSGTTGAPRPARPASQRPQVNTSRIERRRAPSVGSQPSTVTGTIGQSSSAKSAASEVPKPGQRESSSVKNVKTDGEPTSVSEYFFSDIFTQVEEPN